MFPNPNRQISVWFALLIYNAPYVLRSGSRDRVVVDFHFIFGVYLYYLFTILHVCSLNAEQNIAVMPFHTCGPNEAMVVSGKLLF